VKKTIKGIVYNTRGAKDIARIIYLNRGTFLFRNKTGHFFLFRRRTYVDGKPAPSSQLFEEAYPDLDRDNPSDEFFGRVEERHTITPMTRPQALAWCVRHFIPRCFHNEFSRYL
jgi:hypothetical protein